MPAPAYGAYAPSTNGMAVAAFVLGLLSFSVLAIIFGHIALSQIKRSQGTQGGRGLAIAGVILGWIWVVLGVALVIGLYALASQSTY
jgi:hypothetical protein